MSKARTIAELATAKSGSYSIGQAAEITGLTAKKIRHYESLRLIPRASRTLGDYRVYTSVDLHALRFIRRARALGFSMKEIEGLLGLWRNQRRASSEVKRLASKHIQDLEGKIAELRAMCDALAQLSNNCHGDERPECPILDDLSLLPAAKG